METGKAAVEPIPLLPPGKRLVLFDGVCNLCSSAVQTIIRNDRKGLYRFASLQSPSGRRVLEERGLLDSGIDSMVMVDPGKAFYLKSSAALEIGVSFGGLWVLLAVFRWLPEGLRDPIYDFVARNRYRWFGKKDACWIPTPELKSRFIDT